MGLVPTKFVDCSWQWLGPWDSLLCRSVHGLCVHGVQFKCRTDHGSEALKWGVLLEQAGVEMARSCSCHALHDAGRALCMMLGVHGLLSQGLCGIVPSRAVSGSLPVVRALPNSQVLRNMFPA
jgi:hypothetical protein